MATSIFDRVRAAASLADDPDPRIAMAAKQALKGLVAELERTPGVTMRKNPSGGIARRAPAGQARLTKVASSSVQKLVGSPSSKTVDAARIGELKQRIRDAEELLAASDPRLAQAAREVLKNARAQLEKLETSCGRPGPPGGR